MVETESKKSEVEVEEDSIFPNAAHHKRWTAAKLIIVFGALGSALAGIIVPPLVAYISRPARPKDNTMEVLKALKEESERQNKQIQQTHEDLLELRSWLAGYLRATGVNVRDPDDPKPPSSSYSTVEIVSPIKGNKKNSKDPHREVITPFPSPRPLQSKKEIPDPIIDPSK
jgi:hypothetical protein